MILLALASCFASSDFGFFTTAATSSNSLESFLFTAGLWLDSGGGANWSRGGGGWCSCQDRTEIAKYLL